VRGVHPVPLTLLDGSEKTALMLGRNVAWICTCHRSRPLEGAVESWSKTNPPHPVICPQCGHEYVIFRADENAQFAQVVEYA
jgi:hypothetical protein